MPHEFTFSKALEASHVIKPDKGVVHNVAARIDATAPSATYYLQIHDAAAVPANGTSNFLARPEKVVHANGIDDEIELDFDGTEDGGRPCKLGAVVLLSSTEFALTLVATPYLSIDADRS